MASICNASAPKDFNKGLRQDEYGGVWRHKIFFNIRYQVPCHDRDFSEEDMGDPREQVFNQEHEESLAPEREGFIAFN